MFELKKIIPLKKELRLFDVYAIATGTTLSAGFFLLPGLAAVEAGPAIILAYMLAAVPLIPAMFSVIELATAMPRAGGVYYFLDRALGPMVGTIGGVGTWLSLILKVSFALVGMGAYIALYFPALSITPVAIALAIVIGIINLLSVKGSGSFQIFLVAILLSLLTLFIFSGIPQIHIGHFNGFFSAGYSKILSTTGLVYISYVGVTKIASLSEEVKKPERNLPLGIFLALGTAFIVYGLGTAVMVGVIPMEILKGDLTPAATAAQLLFGKIGAILISIAALLSFISVANAGTLSASRYPFAMSRDHIVPHAFQRLNKKGIPILSVVITVSIIVAILLLVDPTGIAKLASAFQLLMFALVCFAVIVMRESKIESYDPGYHSPFYPWMQIIGILAPLILIFEMGWLAISFSTGLIVMGVVWYSYYAKRKVIRNGAIYHIFERLGRARYHGLDTELRGILKEKGLRTEDPFDEIIARSYVIDINESCEFKDVVIEASKWLSEIISMPAEDIVNRVLEGTRIGMTPVTHGIALPHFRAKNIDQAEMVLVRSKGGVHITFNNPITGNINDNQIVNAIFFLVSPENDPTQHLRILAQIAGRVDDESFAVEWKNAQHDQELKEALLHDERLLSLNIEEELNTSVFIGKPLRDVKIPKGCLVALMRRDGMTIVPNGNTVFENKDRLTIIGDPSGLNELRKKFES